MLPFAVFPIDPPHKDILQVAYERILINSICMYTTGGGNPCIFYGRLLFPLRTACDRSCENILQITPLCHLRVELVSSTCDLFHLRAPRHGQFLTYNPKIYI